MGSLLRVHNTHLTLFIVKSGYHIFDLVTDAQMIHDKADAKIYLTLSIPYDFLLFPYAHKFKHDVGTYESTPRTFVAAQDLLNTERER